MTSKTRQNERCPGERCTSGWGSGREAGVEAKEERQEDQEGDGVNEKEEEAEDGNGDTEEKEAEDCNDDGNEGRIRRGRGGSSTLGQRQRQRRGGGVLAGQVGAGTGAHSTLKRHQCECNVFDLPRVGEYHMQPHRSACHSTNLVGTSQTGLHTPWAGHLTQSLKNKTPYNCTTQLFCTGFLTQ